MIKNLVVALICLNIWAWSEVANAMNEYELRRIIATAEHMYEGESESNTQTVCIRRAKNGAIEVITEQVFGTTQGAVGAAVGGIIGKKVGGNDAATILGVIVGNKIANDMEHKKNCYVITKE